MIGSSGFQRRRWATAGVAGLLMVAFGVVLGWRNGSAAGAVPAPTAAATWELPHPAAADVEQEADILRQRMPWGGQTAFSNSETPSAAPAPAPATAPWRLVGTVERGTERYALIQIGGQPAGRLEYRAVGEPMPDGGNVLKIDADSVTVQGAGANSEGIVYRLFDKKP